VLETDKYLSAPADRAGWRVFARVDNVTVTKRDVDEEYERLQNDLAFRKAFETH
jgi:hypothetical protein